MDASWFDAVCQGFKIVFLQNVRPESYRFFSSEFGIGVAQLDLWLCSVMRQIEVVGPDGVRTLSSPLPTEAAETKDMKPVLPLSTRGVAWCDIEDDEVPHDPKLSTVETVKVEQSPSKSKRKPRKMKETKERPAAEAPVNQSPSSPSASGVQVTLGDMRLHCTAWNQATSPTSAQSPQSAHGWAPQKASCRLDDAPLPPVAMGTGASVLPDASTVRNLSNEDLEQAEELLEKAQRLLGRLALFEIGA
eukprot:Skav232010  [mRNA]  locus=scaffold719:816649:839640:+ [translate_table: standard]